MKKKLLFIFLLGIIILPLKTYAWTPKNMNYTAKCKTYEVDMTSNNSIRDYFYWTFISSKEDKDNWDMFILKVSNSQIGGYFFTKDFTYPTSCGTSCNLSATDWLLLNASNGNLSKPNNGLNIISSGIQIASTTNLANNRATADTTFQDIEDSYEDYCNITNVEVDFPFDKNDFYVLLILVAIIIMMLFLKWCFPMKGGKKI